MTINTTQDENDKLLSFLKTNEMYGAWTLTKPLEKNLEAFEMWCMRRIVPGDLSQRLETITYGVSLHINL